MTYNVFGATLNLAQLNSILFLLDLLHRLFTLDHYQFFRTYRCLVFSSFDYFLQLYSPINKLYFPLFMFLFLQKLRNVTQRFIAGRVFFSTFCTSLVQKGLSKRRLFYLIA